MILGKKLAVLGLLSSVAAPVSAFDLANLQFSVDEVRARISPLFSWASWPQTVAPAASPPSAAVSAPAPTTALGSAAGGYVAPAPVSYAPPVLAAPAPAPAVQAVAYTAPTAFAAPATLSFAGSAGSASRRVTSARGSFIDMEADALSGARLAPRAGSAVAPTIVETVVEAVVTFAADAADAAGAMIDSATAAAGDAADAVVSAFDAAVATVTETAAEATDTLADTVAALVSSATGGQTLTRELLASTMVTGSQPAPLTGGSASQPVLDGGLASGAQPPVVELPGKDDALFTTEQVPEVIGGQGRTFYVDFANGSDTNSGTSASQPWKRAPGDTVATGNPKAMVLKPGDTVRFKAGVVYRGSFTLRQSGVQGQPIIYTGTGYGKGRAIWDGADPVTSAVKCPSQSACGGASNWASLMLVTFTEPTTKNQKLYDAKGVMFEGTTPGISDPFWGADVSQYAVIPLAQLSAMTAGRVENAQLAAAARGESKARIAVWVQGNQVVERQITAVSGNTVFFDATGVKPYTDRDNKAAIVGAVRSVTKPGLYAHLGGGKAVVYPRAGGGQYSVGTGRSGFNLSTQSYVTIHGIDFVHGTSANGAIREGVILANYGKQSTGIRFEGNRLTDFSLQSGMGTVQLSTATDVVVRGNFVENIEGGSGIRFGGNINNLVVEGNSVRKLGRTGIYLPSVNTALVRGNILSEIQGVHGNAISFYLGHRNVTATGNCVFDSTRPFTFHGDGVDGPEANLKVLKNIFVTSPEGRSAIYSWGSYTHTVTLEDNVTLGWKAGMILNAKDTNVKATRNRTSGLLVSGSKTTPVGWTITNNDNSAALEDSSQAMLTQTGCSVAAMKGKISVSLS